MNIEYLEIENYRNIESLKIDLNRSINVILGSNGQGKTNLLESIFFLSTTKSIRSTNNNNIIKYDELYCKIKCIINTGRKTYIETLINDEGKVYKINSDKISKTSEYIGKLNAVLFYPGETEIFDSFPQRRRRTVDIELGKLCSKYIISLNGYNQLLKNRNKLLKENKINEQLISVIDKQMIPYQKYVINIRDKFIREVNLSINKYYSMFTKNSTKIRIEYKSILEDVDRYDEKITKIYAEGLKRDIYTRMTNIGIHKDDYVFYLGDRLVVNSASQGQKRMILLSFKLSLVEYIYKETKEYPVLLLDDVMSELDLDNQKILFEIIPNNIQTIITTTHLNETIYSKEISIVNLENGKVMEETEC